MRLIFLSNPPSFSVMVTCRYHPVPPCRQASSAGYPHRQAAPSGSLLISSLSSSARAATGLAARAPAAAWAAAAAVALGGLLDEVTRQLQDCGMGRKTKKHAITTAITRAIT